MCVVSMVLDGARRIPPDLWTRPAWDDFIRILPQIEKVDEKLGQPDCKDPEKERWMKDIERRLKRLEAKKMDEKGIIKPPRKARRKAARRTKARR